MLRRKKWDRRAALWHHFSDARSLPLPDLFVINLVLVLMKEVYGQTADDKSLVASMAIWGAVVGQLTVRTEQRARPLMAGGSCDRCMCALECWV
jgi:hypothetical protein